MNMGFEQLAEQMIRGMTEACWVSLMEQVESGRNSLYIYEQWLGPAMRYVGSLWEQNLITVADEHLASGVCDILLTRYAALVKPDQTNGKRGMFLCVEEEAHYFGLKMVSTLFEERGFDARFYGPNLPLEGALLSAMRWKPDVIGLSVSIVYHLPKLRQYVNALASLPSRPTVIIGGRVIEPYGIERGLADQAVFVPTLLELNDWIDSYLLADAEQQIVR
ncbi:B12-binding domain-containing protein [Paenibacillus sp. XY044]|uniref:cobalamin B12-binding domain-containing protein n=1 Tax=Paenibacillus sp. XY044 TaxID=2026089 RepID=UPI000B997BB3|nr:cobalamin-dependent protein [Paenibacillus sp. XY044]OZB93588.1 hypothetical protein CJP46_21590 [Paenibacillus sp. XY044]